MANELEALVVGTLKAVKTKVNKATGEVTYTGRVLSSSEESVAEIKGFAPEHAALVGQQVTVPVLVKAGEFTLYPSLAEGQKVLSHASVSSKG